MITVYRREAQKSIPNPRPPVRAGRARLPGILSDSEKTPGETELNRRGPRGITRVPTTRDERGRKQEGRGESYASSDFQREKAGDAGGEHRHADSQNGGADDCGPADHHGVQPGGHLLRQHPGDQRHGGGGRQQLPGADHHHHRLPDRGRRVQLHLPAPGGGEEGGRQPGALHLHPHRPGPGRNLYGNLPVLHGGPGLRPGGHRRLRGLLHAVRHLCALRGAVHDRQFHPEHVSP